MASAGAGIEIELALRLSDAAIALLLASEALAALRAGKDRRRRLVSTYFDTQAGALAAAGAVLRVRRVGRRHVQTVKRAALPGDSAIARGEWEWTLTGPTPDRALLALEPALADLAAVDAPLVAVCGTDFERIAIPLRRGAARLELAIDRGMLGAGDRRMPLAEIEIELRRGTIADVYAVAASLMAAVPMALETLPKSARAQALRAGAAPPVRRAVRPRLTRDVSVGDALRGILRICLAQLRANAAAIRLGDDPAAMHQFRVALRRMRAAFSAFGFAMPLATRRRFAASLRRIARRSDPARELDVFLTEILPAARARIGNDPGFDALAAVATRARDGAWRRMRALLDRPAFAVAVLDLEAWLEGAGWRDEAGAVHDAPMRPQARAVLRRLQRKLLRAGEAIDGLDIAGLHGLRLRGKKLRYAGEFFRDLFPGRGAKAYLAALAEVQERLGALNDGGALRAMLERLAQDARATDGDFARGAALVLGWAAAREAAGLDALPAAWARFAARRGFWK
jgi:inorganic triphosphatase YgiF